MAETKRPGVKLAEGMKETDAAASYDEEEWRMDPSGYLLIRINPETRKLEVGHCRANNVILQKFTGDNARELCQAVIKAGIISRIDHAAYLGRETLKAEVARKLGVKYVQDSDLEL